MRLVRLDAFIAAQIAAREDPTEEVVQRAERANPTAKHAPEHERERQHHERPSQPAIDRVRAQQRHRAHERVGEQKALDRQRQAHRLTRGGRERAAERRGCQKIQEQTEEADLRHAPHPDQDLDHLACR
jgi:Ni/Co efflux regulator RcnB